jgi:hypothetical protein
MRADRFICVADGPALLGISCVSGKVAYSTTALCRRIEVFTRTYCGLTERDTAIWNMQFGTRLCGLEAGKLMGYTFL